MPEVPGIGGINAGPVCAPPVHLCLRTAHPFHSNVPAQGDTPYVGQYLAHLCGLRRDLSKVARPEKTLVRLTIVPGYTGLLDRYYPYRPGSRGWDRAGGAPARGCACDARIAVPGASVPH